MMHIRAAKFSDLAALVTSDGFAATHPERVAEIERWVAAGEASLAELGDTILGYAVLTRSFFHRPFLEMLMVAERARRSGVGLALVEHCQSLAGSELWTSTNSSNQPMQALLARAGFTRQGIVEGLDDGDPEIVFRRLVEA